MSRKMTTTASSAPIKAPFPYFGGKSRVAHVVWSRLGTIRNYIEPFSGSLAVLLHVPQSSTREETVNDLDCHLVNFWRAIRSDPAGLRESIDRPRTEVDLLAAVRRLNADRADRKERLCRDIDYYDLPAAALWVWAINCWFGGGFCDGSTPSAKKVAGKRTGVHRKTHRGRMDEYLTQLAVRLRHVTVNCGDWRRVLTPSVIGRRRLTGIFLDPPYADTADRHKNIYSCDSLSVAHDVREWAIAHGSDPCLRIALCGYEGEHRMPADWECVAWRAHGGMGNRASGRGRRNRERERIWFSPHCLRPENK